MGSSMLRSTNGPCVYIQAPTVYHFVLYVSCNGQSQYSGLLSAAVYASHRDPSLNVDDYERTGNPGDNDNRHSSFSLSISFLSHRPRYLFL
jgi:hypothetical protein